MHVPARSPTHRMHPLQLSIVSQNLLRSGGGGGGKSGLLGLLPCFNVAGVGCSQQGLNTPVEAEQDTPHCAIDDTLQSKQNSELV